MHQPAIPCPHTRLWTHSHPCLPHSLPPLPPPSFLCCSPGWQEDRSGLCGCLPSQLQWLRLGATDQPLTQRPGLLAVGGVVFAYELLSPFLFIEGSAEDFSMREEMASRTYDMPQCKGRKPLFLVTRTNRKFRDISRALPQTLKLRSRAGSPTVHHLTCVVTAWAWEKSVLVQYQRAVKSQTSEK